MFSLKEFEYFINKNTVGIEKKKNLINNKRFYLFLQCQRGTVLKRVTIRTQSLKKLQSAPILIGFREFIKFFNPIEVLFMFCIELGCPVET